MQVMSMILMPFSRRKSLEFNGFCGKMIWSCMQFVFEKLDKASITYSGDSVPSGESAIVICNHLSFADVYMMHGFAMRKNMLQSCKDSLKWLPGFGWGTYLMGNIMIKRNWTEDKRKIAAAFRNLREMGLPTWLISYPEGTRITPKKLKESQLFASMKSLPILRHVLLPRTKGFVATLKGMVGSHVKAIYDLTILYYHIPSKTIQKAPNILRLHTGRLDDEYKFHMHVKRYDISSLPEAEDELSKWLLDRFVEKDEMIERMKDTWTTGMNLIPGGSAFP